jgi:hypothetical protein
MMSVKAGIYSEVIPDGDRGRERLMEVTRFGGG